MATVKYGPIIQSARGSLGGLVFARTGGASCIRTRPIVRQVQSQAALQTQAFYPAVITAWRNLSTADRTAWQRAAQVYQHPCPDGTTRPISPWIMFATVNLRRLSMNAFNLASGMGPAVAIATLPVFEPGALDTTAPGLAVWPDATTFFYHALPSASLSPCYSLSIQRCWRTSPTRPGRLVKLLYHSQPSQHCQDLSAVFSSLVGSPQAGEQIFWRCTSHMAAWPASLSFSGLITVQSGGVDQMTYGDFEAPAAPAAPTGWSTSGRAVLTTSTTDTWLRTQHAHLASTSYASDSYAYTPYNWTGNPGDVWQLAIAIRRMSPGSLSWIALARQGGGVQPFLSATATNDSLWHYKILTTAVFTNPTGLYRVEFRIPSTTIVSYDLDGLTLRKL